MARFRDAVLAVALATGGVGCATFCDECDDFPVPGGPGGYALMPGSYAGGPLSAAPDTGPAGSPSPAPAPCRPRVPSSRRRSGWRGCSDTTGPTTRQPWPRHRGKRSGSERRRQCHTGSHDHGDNLRLRSSGITVSLPRRRASSSSGQLASASLTRTRVPRPARHASGRREASSLRPQTLLVLVCSRPGRFTNPGRIDHSRKGLRSWRGSLLGYSPWPSCLAFPAAPGQRPIAIIRQE